MNVKYSQNELPQHNLSKCSTNKENKMKGHGSPSIQIRPTIFKALGNLNLSLVVKDEKISAHTHANYPTIDGAAAKLIVFRL